MNNSYVHQGDEASQWKRPKFDPSPHQNPLTDLHKNWQAWLRPLLFVTISLGVFAPQIRDFDVLQGVTIVFNDFSGFLQLPTAYTPKRISTKNTGTSKDVIPAKDVPFGGPGNYIWYLDPKISENCHFMDRFWLDFVFCDWKSL